MSRFVPIRITENDRAEYSRLARNTKAKIKRTIKKYGIDLSGEIQIPDIESFSTRKEFNEWKHKSESFTNRSNLKYQFKKNKYDVVADKKTLLDIDRNTKIAQRKADEVIKQYEDKPFFTGGDKPASTVGQRYAMMKNPNTGIKRPRDFNFENVTSNYDLRMRKERAEKRAKENYYDKRMEQYQGNLIETIEKTFNSDANELVQRLKAMKPDDFYDLSMQYDSFTFDYIYISQIEGGDNNLGYVDRLTNDLDRYERGSNDLKGF